jgi:hypothetical protein
VVFTHKWTVETFMDWGFNCLHWGRFPKSILPCKARYGHGIW